MSRYRDQKFQVAENHSYLFNSGTNIAILDVRHIDYSCEPVTCLLLHSCLAQINSPIKLWLNRPNQCLINAYNYCDIDTIRVEVLQFNKYPHTRNGTNNSGKKMLFPKANKNNSQSDF